MAYGYKRKRRYTRRPYRRTYRRSRVGRRRSHFAPRTQGAGRVPRSLVALANRIRDDPGFAASVMAATSRRPDKVTPYVLPSSAKVKKAYQMAKLFYDAGMDYGEHGFSVASPAQQRFLIAAASHLWDNGGRALDNVNRFSDWWQGAFDRSFTDATSALEL